MRVVRRLRAAATVLVLGLLALGLVHVGILHEQAGGSREMYDYYRENVLEEIGAPNAVAAILLTYRMYDTIFEAAILLCSIVGIMHFLPRKPPGPEPERRSEHEPQR